MTSITLYTHAVYFMKRNGERSFLLQYFNDKKTSLESVMKELDNQGWKSDKYLKAVKLEELKTWPKFKIGNKVHWQAREDVIFTNGIIKQIRWVGNWEYMIAKNAHVFAWIPESKIKVAADIDMEDRKKNYIF